MSSKMLSQKRSASEQSTSTTNNNDTTNGNRQNNTNNNSSTRYNRLLSILTKSLTQSRERIASDAPATIKESYGDMTSLFTSAEDSDGVKSLVDLLLGKLDSVHDRFTSEKLSTTISITSTSSNENSTTTTNSMTRLEQLLNQQTILPTLLKLENAISSVNATETQFTQQEETDKQSAKEAIKLAKSTYISPTTNKKRRILPAESIGCHAYALKQEYQKELEKELEEVTKENEAVEEELKEGWKSWQEGVEGIKVALGVLDELGE